MAWSSSGCRGAGVSECASHTTRKRMGFSRIVDCGSPRGRLSCAEHTAAGGILSFKHKLDCHLGEMLRRRPGDRMPRLTGWLARVILSALVVLSAGPQEAGAAAPARPKATPTARAP